MIVGIDEVGRGAWAGPLVVGAVVLGGAEVKGLTDSKKLTRRQRTVLDLEIRKRAAAIGIGWVSARHIDQIGLSAALKLAASRALGHIRHDYREIIIDGTIRLIDDPRVTLMKKADLLVPSVSAASIIAKVARDNYMRHLDAVFPEYKFASHVGYGTASHQSAIRVQGVTPLHRLSFAPLRKYQTLVDPADGLITEGSGLLSRVTTKQIGDAAENEVSLYLEAQGHTILARNWRTKFCEIDIVSEWEDTIYFTEVKYRRTDTRGGGIAAITAKKLRQMKFAAEYYALKHTLTNVSLRLAVADVSGNTPKVKNFLELR